MTLNESIAQRFVQKISAKRNLSGAERLNIFTKALGHLLEVDRRDFYKKAYAVFDLSRGVEHYLGISRDSEGREYLFSDIRRSDGN